jgi:hypothetical protein
MSEDGPLCSFVLAVRKKRDSETPDAGLISEGTSLIVDEGCPLQLLT